MALVTGRTKRFWEEIRYFENFETYPHNFIVNRFNVFDLRFVLDWGSFWLHSYRIDIVSDRCVY